MVGEALKNYHLEKVEEEFVIGIGNLGPQLKKTTVFGLHMLFETRSSAARNDNLRFK